MGELRASWWRPVLAIWLAGALPSGGVVPGWVERLTVWATPELRELDARAAVIGVELAGLPAPAGTNSGIRRGFQTGRTREGEDLWVELALPGAGAADRVVLVPLVAKGARGEVPGYGFPRRFQLEATDEDGEVHLLLDETGDDFPNPGLYPVSAACPPGARIERIRLTATLPWEQGGPRVLALAEMLVLRGNRNLAAGGSVTASSSRELTPTWSRGNLIDLMTPLGLPVAPSSAKRLGWHSEVATNKETVKSVTIDLGEAHAVEELRLSPAWRRGVPVWYNYGFPSRYIVETATSEDFGDRIVISNQTERSLQPPGQNFQWFKGRTRQPVRFIRVTAKRLRERTGDYVFALGELQAYVGDRNVALGAKVIATESLEDDEWGRAGLTDGLAAGGRLLDLPDWFDGLERRRLLERQQAALRVRRAELLARGEHYLVNGSIGVTGGIAVLASMFVWRSRRQHRLDRERHRERLARDLHDELGSNLGSIALISSFAKDGANDAQEMRHDLAEIEEVARESADSMRDMVDLLGGGHGGASSDWLGVMERLATRLLRGVELDCRLPDGPLVLEPDLETRREVYLFCKEVLYNIAQHAGAESVRFHMASRPGGLRVELADDGCGFDPEASHDGHGLGNLRERAAGLHATLELVSIPGEGTVVTLEVPRGRRWRKPQARQTS
jgi:signal transduction histidine kinase